MRFFSHRNVVMSLGNTLFVHGGVLPSHVEQGLDRINAGVSAWVGNRTQSTSAPRLVRSSSSVLWTRAYSRENAVKCDCEALTRALYMAGMKVR